MTVTIDAVKKAPGRENILVEESFEPIFHAYWGKVHQLLSGLVGDRDEAEDLALEVFWRLYTQLPGNLDSLNVGGWIYRVATNLGYKALRSRNRRRHYENQAGRDQIESTTQHAEIELEKAEQRQMVRQVLSRMKPRSAQILVLRYSGLSYVEIASAIGRSPTSIGTLLARAEREFEKWYSKFERGQL